MRPDDLYRIAELEKRVFGERSFSFSALLQLYGSSGVTWLVAEDADGIWGYSLCMRATGDPRVGWIMALGVHPDRRSEHIGWALLDESIVELRNRGMDAIKLTVNAANVTDYNLFMQAGFQDTGQFRDNLGVGDQHKILTLLLATGPTPSQPEQPPDQQHKEKVPEDIADIGFDF